MKVILNPDEPLKAIQLAEKLVPGLDLTPMKAIVEKLTIWVEADTLYVQEKLDDGSNMTVGFQFVKAPALPSTAVAVGVHP